MSNANKWVIPPTFLQNIQDAPSDRPIAVLLRHSVREPISANDTGVDVPITEIGRVIAHELGRVLGERLKSIHTSPVPRCIQTAQALQDGSRVCCEIRSCALLGNPGIYVHDGRRAWPSWQALGYEGMMDHLVSENIPLPGMARPEEAARFLVHYMLSLISDSPGLHVFVTHDALITPTVARLQRTYHGPSDWPWFLEGALFWKSAEGIHVRYRETECLDAREALCELNESGVMEFAKREVASTVGLDCDARFFLAGGAFKSLVTGRLPRDLDFWASSPRDREVLLERLKKRGAIPLASTPFADVFQMGERVIDVPFKTDFSDLDGLLGGFDIALSAIGVEYRPDGAWGCSIHGEALLSIEKREVLLLEPLVNWKYALVTLQRMQRYAKELRYRVSAKGELSIWELFHSKPVDVREEMLECFKQCCPEGALPQFE